MRENLEYRIKDFRERIMGIELSDKYSFEVSKDGSISEKEPFSGSECALFFSKLFGKLMIPYAGDKNAIEWAKLEGEINPNKKADFYIATGMFIAGKYASLYALLDKVF